MIIFFPGLPATSTMTVSRQDMSPDRKKTTSGRRKITSISWKGKNQLMPPLKTLQVQFIYLYIISNKLYIFFDIFFIFFRW